MDILVPQKREATTNPEKLQAPKRKKKRKSERRKSTMDRRSSMNDGIVVSLSTSPNDKRSRFDRRQCFVPPNSSRAPREYVRSIFVDVVA
jgi:hypothetical protein